MALYRQIEIGRERDRYIEKDRDRERGREIYSLVSRNFCCLPKPSLIYLSSLGFGSVKITQHCQNASGRSCQVLPGLARSLGSGGTCGLKIFDLCLGAGLVQTLTKRTKWDVLR